MLAVPGLERSLVDPVAGLGQEGLVVLLMTDDDLVRGDVADGLADDVLPGQAEQLLEGRVCALIDPLRVLEKGRIGHDGDHVAHELVHVPVGFIPLGLLEMLVGGDGQAPEQDEQGAAENKEGRGHERP